MISKPHRLNLSLAEPEESFMPLRPATDAGRPFHGRHGKLTVIRLNAGELDGQTLIDSNNLPAGFIAPAEDSDIVR